MPSLWFFNCVSFKRNIIMCAVIVIFLIVCLLKARKKKCHIAGEEHYIGALHTSAAIDKLLYVLQHC